MAATFVAILKQLNQAEVQNEGAAPDQALELEEVERRLADFRPVKDGTVKLAVALGLLLQNGLVSADLDPDYSWQRGRVLSRRYKITPEGKQYLVRALASPDRVA